IGNNNALGTGALTFAGGTFNSLVAVTLPNTVVLSSNMAYLTNANIGNAAWDQGTNINFAGTVYVLGTSSINNTATGLTTLSGTITGPGLLTTTGSTGIV